MTIHLRMEKLANTISQKTRKIDRKEIQKFIEEILLSQRIFITGAGRSGLIGKSFAMRLMHLGFKVHVVGETTTPSINEGDLLIAITSSGRTTTVVIISKTAKDRNAKVASITSDPKSPVALNSDVIVKLDAQKETQKENLDYFARQLEGSHTPIAPLGTLFELTTMIFLDAVIEEIMIRQKKSESFLKSLHANLE